jgi:ABC-type uncharacterized transport system permease subunit
MPRDLHTGCTRRSKHFRWLSGGWTNLLISLVAIIIAFALAGVLIAFAGEDPLNAYRTLFKGAFGTRSGIRGTFRYCLPFVLSALSFSICVRSGYFNIGQDGQIYLAALAATWVGVAWKGVPPTVQVIAAVVLGVAAGALCCFIPAVLKVLLGVDEVIMALMLNYIIGLLSTYVLLYSPIAEKGVASAVSKAIPISLPSSVAVAMIVVIFVVYALGMKRTVPGYEMCIVGHNKRFARYGGIPANRTILKSALIGGGLAGLVGVCEVLTVYHLYFDKFTPGLGLNGMAAALLGRHNPIGILFGSLFLGALQSGSVLLSVITEVPSEVIMVIQGLVMFFATVRRKQTNA